MKKAFKDYVRTTLIGTCLFSSSILLAEESSFPARKVPARIIPVPTDVSPDHRGALLSR